MKKSEEKIDSKEYFLEHYTVEGKPLTRKQKDEFKKFMDQYEKLPPDARRIFGKRRRML